MTIEKEQFTMNKRAALHEEDRPAGEDSGKSKQESKLKKLIVGIFNNYAAEKAGDLINELMLGNFKEAVIDVFKSQKASSMSEEDINKAMSELKELPAYKRDKAYAELDSRKDDNTKTDIDEASMKM